MKNTNTLCVIFLISLLSYAHPKKNFIATKVTFESDIPFDKEEFFYLTDLKEKREITQKDIDHACDQLKRKKRFHRIEYKILEKSGLNPPAKRLHFMLTGNWIFKDVIIKGIWFGKHRYQNLYLQHPGDSFDILLHEESIDIIKKTLCSVTDEIIYNRKSKTITVQITIKKRLKRRTSREKSPILKTTHKKFRFVGNKFFSSSDLKNNFLGENRPDWLLDPNIITEQILHKYYQSGFWDARVDYEDNKFRICEGKRIKIDDIEVENASNMFFDKFLEKKLYDENLLNKCLEKLKNFYIEHGFWDFCIKSQRFVKNRSHHFKIHIIAQKGKQRFFSGTSIQGTCLNNSQLLKHHKKNKNLPFNPTWLADQRLEILNHFQKKGYWYVDAQPEFLEHKSHIHVLWRVETGELVKFDKVIIRGNTKLPFKRILKELQFKKGDLWDRKKLDYSRKKLQELNVFKYISMHPKKLSSKQGQKPIILTLIDDNPIELKLRVGYFLTSKNFLLKRDSTYKFGASLLVKNPLNLADKLSLNTNLTRFEKDFDLDYHIPHFFSKTMDANFKTYAHKYIHPLHEGKTDAAYEATQNGFLIGIKKEYKPFSFWGVNVGNEWMKTDRTRGNIKLAPDMINITIPYFFIEPNLLIDNLDDKIETTRGSFTFCSLKTMFPEKTGNTTTFKIMIDRSLFYPVYKKLILATRFRWGHIFRQVFEEIMPIERFFLGGPNSIRGYSKDALPPLQGGSSMINGNIELRFPIYKSFGGVIFQDIGVLSQTGFSGFKGRWYPTSGCGLRYATPIGALRFDIGWKWKKTFTPDTSYAWYLTLGQVF